MPRIRPHPAKAIIVSQGRTIADVASAMGYNAHLLGRVLNRRATAWPKIRAALEVELGLPAAELFDDGDDDRLGAA